MMNVGANSHALHYVGIIIQIPDECSILLGMGPSTCSLGACSVLGIFGGAHAWVLKSEQMLGSLVLGLDARRVLGEHQRITE